MLFIVGLGLDTKDISVRSLEQIKSAHALMLDPYTNIISNQYVEYLENSSGKKIIKLSRADLEENVPKTIGEAIEKDIAILVSGDPMIATTHQILIDQAVKMGIPYKVMHSSSILTAAIGECGLIPYKFGQTTTIPFWSDKYKPTSFLDTISKNKACNYHTIVLLDYNYLKREGLRLNDAINQLIAAEEEKRTGCISANSMVFAMGDVGKPTQLIRYAKISDLQKTSRDFEGKILTLVIPSKLTIAEEDHISRFR